MSGYKALNCYPPLWDPQARRAYYQKHPGAKWEMDEDRTVPGNYEYPRVEWALARILGPRVLDVGIAGGQITREIQGRGYQTDALEPCTYWGNRAREWIEGEVFSCSIEELVRCLQFRGRWDTITMMDVIEHLQDPLHILIGIMARMQPQRLILTTPLNVWEGTCEHLWIFDEEEAQRITSLIGGTCEIISDHQGMPRWIGWQIDCKLPLLRELAFGEVGEGE